MPDTIQELQTACANATNELRRLQDGGRGSIRDQAMRMLVRPGDALVVGTNPVAPGTPGLAVVKEVHPDAVFAPFVMESGREWGTNVTIVERGTAPLRARITELEAELEASRAAVVAARRPMTTLKATWEQDVALAKAGVAGFAVGDTVECTSDLNRLVDREHGISEGTRGTITAIDQPVSDRIPIAVRLGPGRVVWIGPSALRRVADGAPRPTTFTEYRSQPDPAAAFREGDLVYGLNCHAVAPFAFATVDGVYVRHANGSTVCWGIAVQRVDRSDFGTPQTEEVRDLKSKVRDLESKAADEAERKAHGTRELQRLLGPTDSFTEACQRIEDLVELETALVAADEEAERWARASFGARTSTAAREKLVGLLRTLPPMSAVPQRGSMIWYRKPRARR
jgi:hypothetical protein